jgi:hypothetical protein
LLLLGTLGSISWKTFLRVLVGRVLNISNLLLLAIV